jgi:hypothetical protein
LRSVNPTSANFPNSLKRSFKFRHLYQIHLQPMGKIAYFAYWFFIFVDLKRALSIIFILIFLHNLAGVYLFFIIQKHQIRTEIRNQIRQDFPISRCIKLSISLKDYQNPQLFQRIDKHEFRWKGKMYDIVRNEKTENFMVFYCILDERENKLWERLEENIEEYLQQNPQKEKEKNGLISQLLKEYLPSDSFEYQLSKTHKISYPKLINTPDLTFQAIQVPFPPPKSFSLI